MENPSVYKEFQTVCLRTPLLPLASFDLLEDDINVLNIVKSFFNTPLGKEALYLASPDLFNEFKKYQNDLIKDAKKIDRLRYTLLKYYIRLTTRCTPFGLFAGYSPITIDSKTKIEFDSPEKYIRNARIDMNYLCLLLDKISKEDLIRPHLKFYPNSSIYRIGNNLRYVEYTYNGSKRVHNLVGINDNEYLNTILIASNEGTRINEAVAIILDDDIDEDSAYSFVNYLIENQILVSEFEPIVTGIDVLTHLEKLLENLLSRVDESLVIQKIKFYHEFVNRIKNELYQINNNKTNDFLGSYLDLKRLLKEMDVPSEEKHLIQVDLNKTTSFGTVGSEIVKDIYTGLEIFSRFSPRIFRSSRTSQNNHQLFKKAFYERYEHREVDLSEVLDSEFGIGYIQNIKEDADYSDLLKDMNIPAPKDQGLSEITWDGKLHTFWYKKFIEAAKRDSFQIDLNDDDLKAFPPRLNEMGETISVIASMISIDGQMHVEIAGVQGSSASQLLGRFGTSSVEINKLLGEITAKEQECNPNSIVAEIVHLPEARVGNILLRPVNRKYEIPYLAQSNTNKEFQIPLNDLTLSVVNEKIILKSKRYGKEVIPYLSNAHNFSYNSLPFYQFLCDLQSQRNLSDIYINLGILYRVANFYPRIVYRNIVVKPATWLFQRTDLDMFINVEPDLQLSKFKEFCRIHKIPKYVSWMVSDNSLLINTHNFEFVNMFIKEVKKRKSVTLQEYLHGNIGISKEQKSNEFANEIIVSFHRNQENLIVKKSESIIEMPCNPEIKVDRKFSLGDEWIYLKLYCGLKVAEKVLISGLTPLVKKLEKSGYIKSWFYIRYSDPDHHIRLRIRPNDKNHYHKIIEIFKTHIEPFEKSGEIWKTQMDTYVRELERYGLKTISYAEEIFFHDSNFCIDQIKTLKGDLGERFRWFIALKSIDSLLLSFNCSLQEKIEILTMARNSFAIEFNADENLRSFFSKLYTKYKKDISALFTPKDDSWSSSLDNEIAKRENLIKPAVKSIIELSMDPSHVNIWILQYTHMNINRLFKSKQRLHEYVIYDLLIQYYKSVNALMNVDKNSMVSSTVLS